MQNIRFSTVVVVAMLISRPALAIRPFVTDDARVVGNRLAQLETWLRVDGDSIEHNLLGAIGPTRWLELTAGFVHGGVFDTHDTGYSIKGPILQAKVLALPTIDGSHPGIAIAGGVLGPFGNGPFDEEGWGAFGYLAATQSLFAEGVLIHANVGFAAGDDLEHANVTAGIGTQIRAIGGLHGVGEVFYGDPYAPGLEVTAAQIGFRYIFNDRVQVDGTFGSTFEDVDERGTEQWGTLGLRIVSPELW